MITKLMFIININSCGETISPPMIDLTSNCTLTNDCLLSFKIEGGEFLALLGMNETIKKFKPFIQIEIDEKIIAQTPYLKSDILLFFEKNNDESDNPVIANTKREKWSKNYFLRLYNYFFSDHFLKY